jgi:hypothetical protein
MFQSYQAVQAHDRALIKQIPADDASGSGGGFVAP